MKSFWLLPLLLFIHVSFAENSLLTWHNQQTPPAESNLAAPAAYYTGQLKLSALPRQGIVELWWQPKHQAPQLLARTQQAEVPIYWHKALFWKTVGKGQRGVETKKCALDRFFNITCSKVLDQSSKANIMRAYLA